MEHVRRSGECFCVAELQRLQGQLLIAMGQIDSGRAELLRALETGRKQMAEAWIERSQRALEFES
jgi:hypothetical protein